MDRVEPGPTPVDTPAARSGLASDRSIPVGDLSASTHGLPLVAVVGEQVAASSDPPPDSRDDQFLASPLFAAPALVLLAAVAIFEGYQWLHLIPDGSLRPSGMLFALVVVPIAYGLASLGSVGHTAALRRALVASAAVIPVLGTIVLVDHSVVCGRVLGVSSLVLATVAVALVVVSERDHRNRSR